MFSPPRRLQQPEQQSASPSALTSTPSTSATATHDDDDDGEAPTSSLPAMRVLVRIRPLLSNEVEAGHQSSLLRINNESVLQSTNIASQISVVAPNNSSTTTYTFGGVLPPPLSQSDVWCHSQCAAMIDAVSQGFSATIFAYGQTGAGKTYTMDGVSYSSRTVMAASGAEKLVRTITEPQAEDAGITIRAINALFDKAKSTAELIAAQADNNKQAPTIAVSFLQIYQESVFDLLAEGVPASVKKKDEGLRIRWSEREEFYVENLYIIPCKTAKEARGYFLSGLKRRLVAAHKMNHQSSRSHSIFTMYYTHDQRKSKLNVVDLAGSERVSLTGASGLVLQQSISINQSLFVLRKVIKSLVSGVRPPYRDAALTRLLKQSIGGNSLTLMIACINPSDQYVDENISTLNYAEMAGKVQNKASTNEDPNLTLIRALRKEIKMLRALLARSSTLEERDRWALDAANNESSATRKPYTATTSNSTSTKPSQLQLKQQDTQSDRKADTSIIPLSSSPSPATTLSSSPSLSSLLSSSSTSLLAEKLIDSVRIMKGLSDENHTFRQQYNQFVQRIEDLEVNGSQLEAENEDLRQRIHFLETVIIEAQGGEALKSPDDNDDDDDDRARIEVEEEEEKSNKSSNKSKLDEVDIVEYEELQRENQKLKQLLVEQRQQLSSQPAPQTASFHSPIDSHTSAPPAVAHFNMPRPFSNPSAPLARPATSRQHSAHSHSHAAYVPAPPSKTPTSTIHTIQNLLGIGKAIEKEKERSRDRKDKPRSRKGSATHRAAAPLPSSSTFVSPYDTPHTSSLLSPTHLHSSLPLNYQPALTTIPMRVNFEPQIGWAQHTSAPPKPNTNTNPASFNAMAHNLKLQQYAQQQMQQLQAQHGFAYQVPQQPYPYFPSQSHSSSSHAHPYPHVMHSNSNTRR